MVQHRDGGDHVETFRWERIGKRVRGEHRHICSELGGQDAGIYINGYNLAA